MYLFTWQVPGHPAQEVSLRLDSRDSWFGPKTLRCGPRQIFRRGRIAGIECRFRVDELTDPLHLRYRPIPGTPSWRPALFLRGAEIPETSGTIAPHVVARPRAIALITGIALLLMFMALVTLPSITKILTALRLPHADRKYVITVTDPILGERVPSVERLEPRLARESEAYDTTLTARGGTPPYTWQPIRKGWPKNMTLDAATGRIVFTPRNRFDHAAEFTVTDAHGIASDGAVAIVIDSSVPAERGWPRIETHAAPSAVIGEPYHLPLQVSGGQPPLAWSRLKGKLPPGLAIDRATGTISGTPAWDTLFVAALDNRTLLDAGALPAEFVQRFSDAGLLVNRDVDVKIIAPGALWTLADNGRRYLLIARDTGIDVVRDEQQFLVTVRVTDSSYRVGDDIYPWIIPFACTAACLLGYWNMRRVGVVALAVLIVAQLAGKFLTVVPVAGWALVGDAFLLLLGLAYYRQMR